jgi:hypothetical protein
MSRSVTWAGQVTCMGEMRHAYKIILRKPKGKRLLVDGRKILKFIIEKK